LPGIQAGLEHEYNLGARLPLRQLESTFLVSVIKCLIRSKAQQTSDPILIPSFYSCIQHNRKADIALPPFYSCPCPQHAVINALTSTNQILSKTVISKTNSVEQNRVAYRVLKDQGTLPPAALSMVRFHSFYPLHREGAYTHLMNQDTNVEQLTWIKAFNPFDLCSKSPNPPSKQELASYYEALINKYFPPAPGEAMKKLNWPVLLDLH
jgi:hypothetical protein